MLVQFAVPPERIFGSLQAQWVGRLIADLYFTCQACLGPA